MTRWIAAVNAKDDFDIVKAIQELDVIYWGRKNYHFDENDILYMYVNSPDQKIKYKFKVISIIDYVDYPNEQKKYWKSDRFSKYQGQYIGLVLMNKCLKESLSLSFFRENSFLGVTENIQGRRHDRRNGKSDQEYEKVQQWFDYIDSQFFKDQDYDFPEEANVEREIFPEGGKKQIIVNIYERDQIARQKCLDIHGVNCFVCNMNFGRSYGAFAEGFMHVHHLKPLHQIKQNYVVNPKEDLIPVCPNCHAMLHRKINGEEMTVEKLKIFYKYTNK